MNRFYVVLAVLVVVLGGTTVYLLRGGSHTASAAAAGPPPTAVDDGFRGYTLGNADAPVEITEYVDYECPVCATFATVQMPAIKQQLITTGKARWRFRDFPLPIHQYSRFAAHAVQCAGEQGKSMEMQDSLFYNHRWAQTGRDPTNLFRGFAKGAGVNLTQYDDCMQKGRYAARIEFSRQEGNQRMVDGTPTFFADGTRLTFTRLPGSDDFKRIVDSLIAHAPPKPPARHTH